MMNGRFKDMQIHLGLASKAPPPEAAKEAALADFVEGTESQAKVAVSRRSCDQLDKGPQTSFRKSQLGQRTGAWSTSQCDLLLNRQSENITGQNRERSLYEKK